MRGFQDKVVVITGGATGIGRSFATQFANRGATIVLAGRREDRLQEAAEALRTGAADVSTFRCDVVQRAEVEALADHTWQTHGRCDVIVNNAGRGQDSTPVIDTDDEVVRAVMDVNYFGVLNGATVFAHRFIEQGTAAAIYNVGSENSLFIAAPLSGAYVASKHAVLAMTEALREELPDFIEVGLICPGFVVSEFADEALMSAGMNTDRYTDIAMQGIEDGEFFIVSHAYNMARIHARYEAITAAYQRYAPRYDGDDEFDIRTLIARTAGATPAP